jgi:hypothetical protein
MNKKKFIFVALTAVFVIINLESCKKDDPTVVVGNSDTAEKASVDRFSSTAGHLMVRTSSNGLPAANAPVNFDQTPFITKGIGPGGEDVEYYNFDVQSTTPAPIYVLFAEGASTPVEGQFNIIDLLPGEAGYNDFWQVYKVTVPSGYKANQFTSYAEIQSAKYKVEATTTIVNCPVVPFGSTATKRLGGGSAELSKGWDDKKAIYYFNFAEKGITASSGKVPTSPIYVSFNINPELAGGGPASGFVVENGTSKTHNVLSTLPASADYSPLWDVAAYDNASFGTVTNLTTATAGKSKGTGLTGAGSGVNCPVVMSQASATIHDINSASASVDRFSSAAGHLMVRTSSNGLPAANAAVNFDQAPFITKGLGAAGEKVEYYNFDVQSTAPAPIYVLFREGASSPVEGQYNIINVIPGDAGYNDFWQVIKVAVPASYKANQVASYDEIVSAKYAITATTIIVNCPVVPQGSTATKRIGGGSSGLSNGWYKGKRVFYFNFAEKSLTASGGKVQVSTIYVSFNINPDQAGGGPASGFVVENGTMQTHNVVATLPSNSTYSPLWVVNAYDNANFSVVSNLATATSATAKGTGLTGPESGVNCPIVTIP